MAALDRLFGATSGRRFGTPEQWERALARATPTAGSASGGVLPPTGLDRTRAAPPPVDRTRGFDDQFDALPSPPRSRLEEMLQEQNAGQGEASTPSSGPSPAPGVSEGSSTPASGTGSTPTAVGPGSGGFTVGFNAPSPGPTIAGMATGGLLGGLAGGPLGALIGAVLSGGRSLLSGLTFGRGIDVEPDPTVPTMPTMPEPTPPTEEEMGFPEAMGNPEGVPGLPGLSPSEVADAGALGLGDPGVAGNIGEGLGDIGSDAWHRGGPVRDPRPGQQEVAGRLLEGEFVVNPQAARRHRELLEAINRAPGRGIERLLPSDESGRPPWKRGPSRDDRVEPGTKGYRLRESEDLGETWEEVDPDTGLPFPTIEPEQAERVGRSGAPARGLERLLLAGSTRAGGRR